MKSLKTAQRFDDYIGIVSTPGELDYSAQQFSALCASTMGIMQQMPYFSGAEYGLAVVDDELRRS